MNDLFENVLVDRKQKWNNLLIEFDPDSSPMAWEHYRKYYSLADYDFDNLVFYTYYSKLNKKAGLYWNNYWLNYCNEPSRDGKDRLFVLSKGVVTHGGYIGACLRLGGETDFNFNEKKVVLFKKLIGTDVEANEQLERCANMHHTLVNFSLMQGMGEMQGHKGRNRFDRFDTFVADLDDYFMGIDAAILDAASPENVGLLITYLNSFLTVYDYMREIYFITDRDFVDEIVKNGRMPLRDKDDAVRYMNLAEKFWRNKQTYFEYTANLTPGDVLILDSLFPNGGETYTKEQLMERFVSEGICPEEYVKSLFDYCVDYKFIYECGDNVYTK